MCAFPLYIGQSLLPSSDWYSIYLGHLSSSLSKKLQIAEYGMCPSYVSRELHDDQNFIKEYFGLTVHQGEAW
jgi:hypothetical protein